jgi:hypothetical protein
VGPHEALLVASALHAGFQAVVTVVAYPALVEVDPSTWDRAHRAHSRRITWLVAPLYLAVTGACLWTVVAGQRSGLLLAAVAANGVALLVTVVVAAPTHVRLAAQGPDPRLLRRLVVADRLRFAAALTALAVATPAAL